MRQYVFIITDCRDMPLKSFGFFDSLLVLGIGYELSARPNLLQSDWCDNMPIRLYDYAPVLPVNVSRPYFSTRPQGVRAKNLVSGDETRKVGACSLSLGMKGLNTGVITTRK